MAKNKSWDVRAFGPLTIWFYSTEAPTAYRAALGLKREGTERSRTEIWTSDGWRNIDDIIASVHARTKKAAETMRREWGEDYFRELGDISNAKPHRPKGFATNPKLAKIAGAKGGRISRK